MYSGRFMIVKTLSPFYFYLYTTCMLKKRERLTKKEFDTYFATGKRFHTPLLQLIYTPYTSFHGAAVAGKKVHKKAVDRNKLRRRLYNILYHLKVERALSGVYMIIAKPAAKDASYAVLKTDIEKVVGLTKQKR